MTNRATAGILALSLIAGPTYAEYTEGENCFDGQEILANGTCPELSIEKEYVRENFPFNLSAGVLLDYTQTKRAIGINTVHEDGRFNFGGSSQGGAVEPCQNTPMGPDEDRVIITPTALNGCGGG